MGASCPSGSPAQAWPRCPHTTHDTGHSTLVASNRDGQGAWLLQDPLDSGTPAEAGFPLGTHPEMGKLGAMQTPTCMTFVPLLHSVELHTRKFYAGTAGLGPELGRCPPPGPPAPVQPSWTTAPTGPHHITSAMLPLGHWPSSGAHDSRKA